MLKVLLLCIAIAACGKSKTAEPEPAPKTSEPPPSSAPKLQVTLDGKPIEIVSVLARQVEDKKAHVFFVDRLFTCEDLKQYSAPVAGTAFSVQLGNMLQPDGKHAWSVTGRTMAGVAVTKWSGGDPPIPGKVSLAEGATFELPVDFKLKGMPDNGFELLEVKGTTKATVCASIAQTKPAPAAQPDAFITIGSTKLPIVGAGWQAGIVGDRAFKVSTAPLTCGNAILQGDSDLEVVAMWKDGKFTAAKLTGSTVPDLETTTHALAIEPPTPPAAGVAEVEVKLGGTAKLGAFEVSLSGTVKAQNCK